jgi:DNA polymerase-4
MSELIQQRRKIIHLDMDAFFVSVEIRDRPELKTLPVAVGGNKERRGVIATCNYIARQYGVRSAMSTHKALQLCPNLVLVSGRMPVYKQVSAQLRKIMQRYTPIIEPLSLDEAYLDVTDCRLFQGSATLIAQDLRKTIELELKLTASAGISSLKYLAKIASDLNKPNGQYVITPDQTVSFIKQLPLNKISGVGKVTAEKLHRLGLHTGDDIRRSNNALLLQHFGKFGGVLWQRCQGIDDRNIVTTRQRKSVGVERTFSEDIVNSKELEIILIDKLLPELKQRAQSHLPKQTISKLGVKVKFNDFQQTTKEVICHEFNEILLVELLKQAVDRGQGKAVRLLGVHIGLINITKETTNQLTLF